jgi:hypothetical protein
MAPPAAGGDAPEDRRRGNSSAGWGSGTRNAGTHNSTTKSGLPLSQLGDKLSPSNGAGQRDRSSPRTWFRHWNRKPNPTVVSNLQRWYSRFHHQHGLPNCWLARPTIDAWSFAAGRQLASRRSRMVIRKRGFRVAVVRCEPRAPAGHSDPSHSLAAVRHGHRRAARCGYRRRTWLSEDSGRRLSKSVENGTDLADPFSSFDPKGVMS